MSLNLLYKVRPDERFHLQLKEPRIKTITRFGPYRMVEWTDIFLPDGSPGEWTNVTLRLGTTDKKGHFRAVQYYWGTVKCDGGRTDMLRSGQLGGTLLEMIGYVMTTTPKEMLSVRIHNADEVPVWRNMGGA